jgi:hypothetical protein
VRPRRQRAEACRQAGNQGLCTVDDDHCIDSAIICGTASDSGDCSCFVTTAGRSFCGNNSEIQLGNCGCASNTQCQRLLGDGARCVQVADLCEGSCPSGATSGCMAPCPELNPPA